ncbi:uncharacterized protein METZ01_LOCUS87248, partial [marine metagenome]
VQQSLEVSLFQIVRRDFYETMYAIQFQNHIYDTVLALPPKYNNAQVWARSLDQTHSFHPDDSPPQT